MSYSKRTIWIFEFRAVTDYGISEEELVTHLVNVCG